MPHPVLPPLAGLIRYGLRHRIRGSTRAAFLLARHVPLLQRVPIVVNGAHVLFVDLRDGLSHRLLAGTPYAGVPWEVDEQHVMRQLVRRGDVIYDIGAHLGLHMVLLSELAGDEGVVHAFEPNPAKLPTLRLTAGRLSNTTVHPFGLADRNGRSVLFVPEDESMASLSDWTGGRVGPVRQRVCELKRLDPLVSAGEVPPADFIKCDVEGAEMDVFIGAASVVDRADAPVILYEANARSAAAFGRPVHAATRLLQGLRAPAYSIFHVQEGAKLTPLDAFREDCDHYNLVAVPRARLDRLP